MKDRNTIEIVGKLASYKLEEKTFDNSGEAIVGSVTIQVNEDGGKQEVRFFATPTYKNGNRNNSYVFLSKIMDEELISIEKGGEDEAAWVSISANFDTNYFVGRDGTCNDPEDLLRSQQIRGKFIQAPRKQEYMMKWRVDTLITKIREQEENPENGNPHNVIIDGYYIDAYHKRLLECSFRAYKEPAINYYLGLADEVNEDNPYYAQVWGSIKSIVTKTVLKNSFGEDEINEYPRDVLAIDGMTERYEFSSDAVSLSEETYKEFKEGLKAFKQEKFQALVGNNEEDSELAF